MEVYNSEYYVHLIYVTAKKIENRSKVLYVKISPDSSGDPNDVIANYISPNKNDGAVRGR